MFKNVFLLAVFGQFLVFKNTIFWVSIALRQRVGQGTTFVPRQKDSQKVGLGTLLQVHQ
jgi:hypothetical protein